MVNYQLSVISDQLSVKVENFGRKKNLQERFVVVALATIAARYIKRLLFTYLYQFLVEIMDCRYCSINYCVDEFF